MRIEFHNWFRSKCNWWFAILPEAAINYASLDGFTTITINTGWLFWRVVIYIDKGMDKFFTNNKED